MENSKYMCTICHKAANEPGQCCNAHFLHLVKYGSKDLYLGEKGSGSFYMLDGNTFKKTNLWTKNTTGERQ